MHDTDLSQRIRSVRETLSDVTQVLDLPTLKNEVAELERRAAEPGLWDDPQRAQKITSSMSHKQAKIKRVDRVAHRLDDLEVLLELASEEGDADSQREAETELDELERVIAELEVQTLLSGEYDQYPAVMTIRAGAGGVDAADFAEMLQRMYLRYGEQHG